MPSTLREVLAALHTKRRAASSIDAAAVPGSNPESALYLNHITCRPVTDVTPVGARLRARLGLPWTTCAKNGPPMSNL
jgi:hypothetical protein